MLYDGSFFLWGQFLCSQLLIPLDSEQLQDKEYIQIVFSAVLTNTKCSI